MMQRALVTCEFLISPGICEATDVEDQILNVVELSSSLQDMAAPPILEDETLERLIDMQAYPTEKFFRQRIGADATPHSARDIARIVNSIIQRAETLETTSPSRVLTWKSLTISPKLESRAPERAKDLTALLGRMALCQERLELNLDLLHPKNAASSRATDIYDIDGIIDDCLQDDGPPPCGPVKAKVRAFYLFKRHLSHLDYKSCFDNSKNEGQIKFSIYCGTLAKLRERGLPLEGVSLDSIRIGTDFVNSLMRHQAGPLMNFAGALIDVITDLLSGSPKYEVSAFHQSDLKTQKMHGKMAAYRTHITKSGAALRLMLWKDECGEITLANVGPKQELFIAHP